MSFEVPSDKLFVQQKDYNSVVKFQHLNMSAYKQGVLTIIIKIIIFRIFNFKLTQIELQTQNEL